MKRILLLSVLLLCFRPTDARCETPRKTWGRKLTPAQLPDTIRQVLLQQFARHESYFDYRHDKQHIRVCMTDG